MRSSIVPVHMPLSKHLMVVSMAFFFLVFGCGQEKTALLRSEENTGPIEDPDVEAPRESRAPTRMSVDMLADSIPIVAGNDMDGNPIRWKVEIDGRLYDALLDDVLGETLGRPNYVNTTEESSEPSLLYVKFMDDMARNVCDQMLEADYSKSEQETRNLLRFSALDNIQEKASIEENLRYLSLRFLGQKIPEDDQASIADLKKVFDDVVALYPEATSKERARHGWKVVCVALLSSPAFHLY